MTDAYDDGWEGTILAIKQNGSIIKTLGDNFTNGSISGPVQVTVRLASEVQIIVYQLGLYTSQVGFFIKTSNGTKIYNRTNGTSFTPITILFTFCPGGGVCPDSTTVTYNLTTIDSYGDGWEGTILSFKFNGTVLYTFTLTTGAVNRSIPFSFPRRENISVGVYVLGNYTNQVGFALVNGEGSMVFQRIPGNKFFVNSLLGIFCAECFNLRRVPVLGSNTPTP